MASISGTRLGPYQFLSPLGAAGMGEVYRARDKRLGRDAASKAISSQLADDPRLQERVERSIRLLQVARFPIGRRGCASAGPLDFTQGKHGGLTVNHSWFRYQV